MISEALIEQKLAEIFSDVKFKDSPAGLYDPLRYMIGIGGKRIRPRLCLTTYSLYRDEWGDGVIDAATALEVFHTFTLIHDDVMDKSGIRRGCPTVWKKWDTDTALLSGDVMSIDSYSRLSKVSGKVLPRALELFSRTAAEVCEGQQYDMEFENVSSIAMSDYIRMIGLKTACLIACAAQMGALVADAPQQDCSLLYDFGFNLGLAFQIADDYLDTFGNEVTFGKAIGSDILNGKKTWLLTKAIEKDEIAIMAAMSIPTGTPEKDKERICRVKDCYKQLGVDEDAKYEIIHYHTLAMECAEKIGLSRIKTAMLARYADRLIGRNR